MPPASDHQSLRQHDEGYHRPRPWWVRVLLDVAVGLMLLAALMGVGHRLVSLFWDLP